MDLPRQLCRSFVYGGCLRGTSTNVKLDGNAIRGLGLRGHGLVVAFSWVPLPTSKVKNPDFGEL